MDPSRSLERIPCPACGGAGGGPFGRAGGAWDDEAWVCPRCKGVGMVALADDDALPSQRPGLVKAAPDAAAAPAEKKRKASA
ncbi:MAG: hypothetical protein JST00_12995 [Deltaproteobacteria bacterium]|nr:hypothetical protein [Deltaproteobacteria bacterium]